MRNVTLGLIALVALLGAACSSGSEATPEPAIADAEATPARSVADVVADATATSSGASDSTSSGGGTAGGTGEQVASQRPNRLQIETPERRALVEAIESTQALSSYEFTWSMTMASIPELPQGFTLGGDGAIDPANERFAMTMDFGDMVKALTAADSTATAEELALLEAFLGDGQMEIRYVDGVTYINWALFGLMLGSETPWIAIEDESSENAFDSVSSFGGGQFASPEDAVAFLNDVWGVEELGRETVRGVETTHYSGVIDSKLLMSQLSPDEVASLEADLNGSDLSDICGDFPIDVWIDDEWIMRRFVMAFDFSEFGSAGAAAASTIGSMTMSYEFFNVGGAISIVAPPASEATAVNESFLDGFSIAG